jgi:hypothetical protein
MNCLELKNYLNNAIKNKRNVNMIYNLENIGKVSFTFNYLNDTFLILSGKFLLIFEPNGFKKCININTIIIN